MDYVEIPLEAEIYDRLETTAKKQGMTIQEFVDTELVKYILKIIRQ